MNSLHSDADHSVFGVRASWVAPMDGGNTHSLISDGLILVHGSKIVSVGPFDEASVEANIPIIHLEGQLLIPGLVNCHTHAAMSLLRGFADDMSLHEWLTDAIWPAEAKFVDPDYVRLGTKLAVYEFLKTGTTTFVDQYFHSDVSAEVCERIGIRIACGLPVIDKHDGRLFDDICDSLEQTSVLASLHDPDYVIPMLNPHACYTVPAEGLGLMGEFSKSRSCPVHIHLHESQHECDVYEDTHGGKSAIEALIDAGLFNSKLIAAHCVCLSQAERQLLADHKVNVVHCPKSNMKLASGVCPVQALLDMGVNVALGTDGACSNNGLSMLSEMQAVALVGKTVSCAKFHTEKRTGDASAVSCHTALKMATYSGAKALGMLDKIGSIEPGKLADFVAVDLTAPECLPIYDPISTLVYSTGAKVSNVWIGGRRMVKDGVVTAPLELSMEEVKQKGLEIAEFQKERMKQRLVASAAKIVSDST